MRGREKWIKRVLKKKKKDNSGQLGRQGLGQHIPLTDYDNAACGGWGAVGSVEGKRDWS